MCTLHKGVYTLWRIVPTRNNYLLLKLINTQDQRTFLLAWCWLLRISAAGFWKFHHESQILPITEDLCFRESPVPRLKHAHNAVGELWGLPDNPYLSHWGGFADELILYYLPVVKKSYYPFKCMPSEAMIYFEDFDCLNKLLSLTVKIYQMKFSLYESNNVCIICWKSWFLQPCMVGIAKWCVT